MSKEINPKTYKCVKSLNDSFTAGKIYKDNGDGWFINDEGKSHGIVPSIIAKHFEEITARETIDVEKLAEETISVAANEYYALNKFKSDQCMQIIFIAGASWQKEQSNNAFIALIEKEIEKYSDPMLIEYPIANEMAKAVCNVFNNILKTIKVKE